jgi:hypothetical protein
MRDTAKDYMSKHVASIVTETPSDYVVYTNGGPVEFKGNYPGWIAAKSFATQEGRDIMHKGKSVWEPPHQATPGNFLEGLLVIHNTPNTL